MMEFGWAPLRSVRSGPWKYVAAPRPELFDIERDTGERTNVVAAQTAVAQGLDERAARYSGTAWPDAQTPGSAADASRRLHSLGYLSGSSTGQRPDPDHLPDPKDRRALAARLAQVTSGELTGAALIAALEGVVREDPRNGQARLRLGVVRAEAGDCVRAEPEFHAAIDAGLPSADAYLGLASCLGARRDLDGARQALDSARRLEPDNPIVGAKPRHPRGRPGQPAGGDPGPRGGGDGRPDLHEARFNLAVVYARAGDRPTPPAPPGSSSGDCRRMPSSGPRSSAS